MHVLQASYEDVSARQESYGDHGKAAKCHGRDVSRFNRRKASRTPRSRSDSNKISHTHEKREKRE